MNIIIPLILNEYKLATSIVVLIWWIIVPLGVSAAVPKSLSEEDSTKIIIFKVGI